METCIVGNKDILAWGVGFSLSEFSNILYGMSIM